MINNYTDKLSPPGRCVQANCGFKYFPLGFHYIAVADGAITRFSRCSMDAVQIKNELNT
jgi:hypothetical protein